MDKENVVSIKLTTEEITKVNEALKTLQEVFKPHLVTISTDERKTLPKMNEKTVPFVKKVLEYAESHPEFAPAYLNLQELRTDVEAFDLLTKFSRPLDELATALDDTTMLTGSEAYVVCLSYYNAVQRAVKMNVPGAKVVYEELKTRFEANGIRAEKTIKETAATRSE